MNPIDIRSSFVVGEWTAHPSSLSLERGPDHVRIEPKVMELLVRLAEDPGRVHTRRELLDTVWPDVVVGDDALTRAVYELRKALGDRSSDPRYIETIPTKGYRLVADVRGAEGRRPSAHRTIRIGPAVVIGIALGAGALAWSLMRSDASPSLPTDMPRAVTVTGEPGIERDPAMSPDGERIVYARSETNGTSHLVVRSFPRGAPRRVTRGDARHYAPEWSPDGHRIAALRIEDDRCSIIAMGTSGSPAEVLATCRGATRNSLYHHLSWSSDGRWLAFSDGEYSPDEARIHVIDLATGRTDSLALPGDNGAALVPTFSPDGTRIAFVRRLEDAHDLVVSEFGPGPELGPPRVVVRGVNHVDGIAWGSDGRRLVFSSDRSGRWSLYRVSLDGGKVVPLVLGARHPDVVPGEDRVVFEAWTMDVDLWAFPVSEDGVGLRWPGSRLLDSTEVDMHPALSPDGRKLAFLSNRTGEMEVWVAGSDGSDPRAVTNLRAHGMIRPTWSPDGRRLLFGAQVDSGAELNWDLWVLDYEAESARKLTDWSGEQFVGVWSDDGRTVYAGSRHTGEWEIWRIPVNGGRPIRVSERGGFVPGIGAGRLFYTKYEVDGLWSRPLDGGPEVRITSRFPAWDVFWIAQDEAVWRIVEEPGTHLARLDTRSGQWSRVLPLPDDVEGAFDLAPGSQTLYLAREAETTSDIRVVPF